MTLATKQEHDVLDWLKRRRVRSDCVACGHEGWEIGDIIAPPATPHGGGTVIGGPTFPMVQVFCANCGYVNWDHHKAVDKQRKVGADNAEPAATA